MSSMSGVAGAIDLSRVKGTMTSRPRNPRSAILIADGSAIESQGEVEPYSEDRDPAIVKLPSGYQELGMLGQGGVEIVIRAQHL